MEHIDLLYAATKLVTDSGFGSPSMLRRCLRRDYNVSVPFEICELLLDIMGRHQIVGSARGSKAREVLMDYGQACAALRASRGGSWGIPEAA
jgi:hypothetical protein